MAEKKIVSADTLSKTKSKSTGAKPKLDLNKLKDLVVDNKDTIEKVVEVAGQYLAKDSGTKKSTKKTASKKTTKSTKSNSDSLSKMIDLAGTFLKK